jgi:hypothetical protein
VYSFILKKETSKIFPTSLQSVNYNYHAHPPVLHTIALHPTSAGDSQYIPQQAALPNAFFGLSLFLCHVWFYVILHTTTQPNSASNFCKKKIFTYVFCFACSAAPHQLQTHHYRSLRSVSMLTKRIIIFFSKNEFVFKILKVHIFSSSTEIL